MASALRLDNPAGRVVPPAAYRACGLDPDNIERDEPYIHNAVTWVYQVGGVVDALRSISPAEGWVQFRYEEICANPVEAQKRLAAFLGSRGPVADPPEIDISRTGDFRADDNKIEKFGRSAGDWPSNSVTSFEDRLWST